MRPFFARRGSHSKRFEAVIGCRQCGQLQPAAFLCMVAAFALSGAKAVAGLVIVWAMLLHA